MALANLVHLNGNLFCGVDVETTGLDHEKHEIYSLAIIPMDDQLHRSSKRKWLDLKIKPNRIDDIDWAGMGRNQSAVRDAIEHGLESNTAMDLLDYWFNLQELGVKKIAPVGHNYGFDSRFLRAWLGNLNYESKFADYDIRDTMVVAQFFNDLSDFRNDDAVPFRQVKLSYLAKTLNVKGDYGQAHTALADVATTIDVYQALIEEMNRKMLF